MDLNQLNYFRVVAEHEHMTRAAEQLHISQPSLSATISRLEKEIGSPLFDRTGNKIYLNENGRTFLRYVNRIQRELDRGITEIRKNREAGLSRISYCTYGPGITDDLVMRFILTNPTASILHTLGTHEEMLAMLENDAIDFAITNQADRSGKYDEIPLFTDHMLILVSSAHPLSGHPTVDLRDLAHERFAVFNEDRAHMEITTQLCQEAGFTPDILYNGNEISLILSLVASNLCVFLCQFSNGVFGKDDPRTSNSKTLICPSECRPNVYTPVSILFRRDKELSPPVRAFVELIRRSYSTITAG
mgnify:CR=1 FL=1